MTDVVSFVTPTATSSGSSSAQSAKTLAGNYNTFLTLLTAQIQNQDPLKPMDSAEFTQQLVEYSGVEQQIRTNTSLETLISQSKSSTGASLAGYLGQQVEIGKPGATYAGQPINWRYSLPSTADSATITVTNAKGDVVYSQSGATASGPHDFKWDGSVFGGGRANAGDPFYIDVVAKDADGAAITAKYSVVSKVTGVDLSYGDPAITTPTGIYAYSDIIRVTGAN